MKSPPQVNAYSFVYQSDWWYHSIHCFLPFLVLYKIADRADKDSVRIFLLDLKEELKGQKWKGLGGGRKGYKL